MSIKQNDNFYIHAGKPIDSKFGPYISIEEALILIPRSYRYNGLFFGIYDDVNNLLTTEVTYYYFYGDFSDTEYKRIGKTPVDNVYNNQSELFGNQDKQLINFFYYIIDDEIYYEYLGTTNGNISDYRINGATGQSIKIIDEEDNELPLQNKLKFDRFTVSDDPTNDRTVIQRPSDTKIRLSSNIPTNPLEGDEWTNSATWKTYKFYDGFWVEIPSSPNTVNVEVLGPNIIAALLGAASPNGSNVFATMQDIPQVVPPNRITQIGSIIFDTDTQTTLDGWGWKIGGIEYTSGEIILVVDDHDPDFLRPDYFIGMPDGSIDYRASTLDLFGNSVPPTLANDEVLLKIVNRNPDGSNVVNEPVGDFIDNIFQTANQENTVGKYALVWEGTLYPNGNYQIHLLYGATSADPDWVTSAAGKSGYLVLNIFSHDGLPITGSQFYTVDTNSEDGDWVLLRTGDQIKLYHYSTQYWMRVKFRVLYNNFTEVIAGFKNFETYVTLPSGADQQLNSTKFEGTQSLQKVTDIGNSTTNDIEFGTGVGVLLANSSRLREGTIDAGLGGTKGIAQICGVGYELKWEAGRLYVMNGDGTGIRWSLYNFTTTPTVDDDVTKGYGIGSRWALDDGTVYVCSDATTGAAVWTTIVVGTVTNVTALGPLSSSGGVMPQISITKATALVDGYLASTDFTIFNGKQDALVSGTNIKTINSTSILGSGNITTGTVTSITTTTGLTGGTITSTGTLGFDIPWGDIRYAQQIEVLSSQSLWSHVASQNGIDFTPYTTGSSGYPTTLGYAVAFYASTSDSTSGFGRTFALNRAYNTESYYLGSPNTSGTHNGWRLIYHAGNLTLGTLGGVPTTTTISINGTTFDLSANRTWSVGTVTSVGVSSATSGVTIGSTPITTNGTITLTIATASGSQQGLLSSTDWNTFNGKQGAITLTTTGSSGAATFSGGTLNIPQYSGGGGGGSSPITIENTTSLFSTGLTDTGVGSTATYSNFFGYQTGYNATNASYSNFFGYQTGYNATNAYYSNFFGRGAGYNATNASYSNFLGDYAGDGATNAPGSNFFGTYTGYNATDAYQSNFFGYGAGSFATNAYYSNFFGEYAGYQATDAAYSNFFGQYAGYSATDAANSIFIGRNAGAGDTVDNTSNGLSSILIGSFTNTGGFSNSILLGSGTISSPMANTKANQFMLADTITDVRWSGIEYTLPSTQAANAGDVLSNDGFGVLSWVAGGGGGGGGGSSPITIENTTSLFSTGLTDTGVGSTAFGSNFFGESAGSYSTNANNSNFFGTYTGYNATDAYQSNFFGTGAGLNASGASNSNFFGASAGFFATNASFSNFFGINAGSSAINANNSNFFGEYAGGGATNASFSNFFGQYAGYNATNANNSNFFGFGAGNAATNASYSNLIGFKAGSSFTLNNIGTNNIIIGTNISLPNATVNAINLGGVLFGTGTQADITGDPRTVPTSSGRIGIGIVTPTAVLDLRASTTAEATIRLRVSPAPTSPNDGDIWLESNTITGLKIRLGGVTRTVTIA
jgi:hypothetical protein